MATSAQEAANQRRRRQNHIAAIVPLEASLESFFDRALDAIDDEGWIPDTSAEIPPVPGCDEFTLSWRKATGSGGPQLRAQWSQSYDINHAFVPEVLYHPQIGVLHDGVEECGIETLIAPGDAEVFERSSVLTRRAGLTATMSGDVGDMFRSMWGRSADQGRFSSEMNRYRMAVRQDFPTQGECTTVMMPRHPKTGELVLEWEDMRAAVWNVRPQSESSKMIFTLFEELLAVPKWLTELATMTIIRSRRTELHRMLQWMPRFVDYAFQKRISTDASYVIATIKKSCRGGPLLPLSVGDGLISLDKWEQFDIKRQPVSAYLNEFLRRLGFLETIFYDSLHGKRLVHFQAAVQLGAWNRVRATFNERFREQRAAFRHIRGGRTSPEFEIDVEPRFLTPPPIDEGLHVGDLSAALPCLPRNPHVETFTVQRTFLHFSERPHATSLRRSHSASP